MSKIILEKFEIKNNKENLSKQEKETMGKKTRTHEEDFIEVIETEEVTIEDVTDDSFAEHIVNNKKRGFRCTDPTTNAEQQKEVPEKPTYASATATTNKIKPSVPAPGSAPGPAPGTAPDPALGPAPGSTQPTNSYHGNRPGKLFCTFFNNASQCFHGDQCKFV